jgi:hypothetical protein
LALGFAINGLVRQDLQGLMRKGGMQPGDLLILSKPIGVGTLLVAHRPKSGPGPWTVEPLQLGTPSKVASYIIGFGQDNEGELYVLTNGNIGLTPGKGEVWKLGPATP